MKTWVLILCSVGQTLMAKWIEPPRQSSQGHLVPRPDYQPDFPRDHGAHRDFGLEWWYWVGHLKEVDGEREFGFQSTVFRIAGDSQDSLETDEESFGHRQLHLAHSALSDLSEGKYLFHERALREGWQARVSEKTLEMKVAGIEAELTGEGNSHRLLTQYPGEGMLTLTLTPKKPLVRFGERGLSRKGDDPASVSWYWTYTRLEAEGTLAIESERISVKGSAWMDHETSSSQLGEGLVGWDWTCMHLEDGTEVKAYRLRKEDGTSDRWSAVYWVDRGGKTQSVYSDRFSWEEDEWWTSETTGLRYPTSVSVTADHPQKGKVTYRLRPMLSDQEFVGNRADNAYWEGACEVLDLEGARIGRAYLELAGYGGGLGARLN